MKKTVTGLSSLLVTLLLAGNASASTYPVMIVNNSALPITISYSLCDAQKQMCTTVKENSIDSVQSGNNHLSIVAEMQPKLEHLYIVSAVAKDANGQQVATLQKTCDLPEDASAVILNNHGTSRLICQYGQ